MNWLGTAFLGVAVTTSAFIWDIGNPLRMNHSSTSPGGATETVHVCQDEGLTQKGLYKKPARSLWNRLESTPWRLSRQYG